MRLACCHMHTYAIPSFIDCRSNSGCTALNGVRRAEQELVSNNSSRGGLMPQRLIPVAGRPGGPGQTFQRYIFRTAVKVAVHDQTRINIVPGE